MKVKDMEVTISNSSRRTKVAPQEFVIDRAQPDQAIGTGLAGYMEISYEHLVQLFGQPNVVHPDTGPSGDGKVKAEWVMSIDGIIFTIYDYKSDLDPADHTDWHIGSKKRIVIPALAACLKTWGVTVKAEGEPA